MNRKLQEMCVASCPARRRMYNSNGDMIASFGLHGLWYKPWTLRYGWVRLTQLPPEPPESEQLFFGLLTVVTSVVLLAFVATVGPTALMMLTILLFLIPSCLLFVGRQSEA